MSSRNGGSVIGEEKSGKRHEHAHHGDSGPRLESSRVPQHTPTVWTQDGRANACDKNPDGDENAPESKKRRPNQTGETPR
jgi:hypothetical protein